MLCVISLVCRPHSHICCAHAIIFCGPAQASSSRAVLIKPSVKNNAIINGLSFGISLSEISSSASMLCSCLLVAFIFLMLSFLLFSYRVHISTAGAMFFLLLIEHGMKALLQCI